MKISSGTRTLTAVAGLVAVAALLSLPLPPEEVIAEELRLAARALGRITGRVDIEEVLGEIFKNFCIGK